MEIRNKKVHKEAKKELIEQVEREIAKSEIMQAYYLERAANEESKEKQNQYALKENQVREALKFNVGFLQFIETYKF